MLTGQDSGSKVIPASLGTTQPQQEKVVGSSPGQPAVQVEASLHCFLMLSVTERKSDRVTFCLLAVSGIICAVSPVALCAHESVLRRPSLWARPRYVNVDRMNVSVLLLSYLQCCHFPMN